MAQCRDFCLRLSRRKQVDSDDELYETPLRRTLSTVQLTIMGMGAMMGSGLYVFTGVIAKDVAGPAIIISYIIAAIASILSSLCYVEFACRIPRTGSAYTFAYIALGEIWAFVIGWDLVLEYVITAAALASSIIGYLDPLTGYALRNVTVDTIMGGHLWDVPLLSPYPNLFAPLVVVLVTVFIITGAKVSSWVTTFCMTVNMAIVGVIVVIGFTEVDISNWEDYGGFVPNGPSSVIAGAATLFFSFVGFDAIAMANEETVNPRKSIPLATFVAILITSVCYIVAAAVLTLIIPYPEIDEYSAFSSAFQQRGIEWTRWMVSVGALCAMFSALVMQLYCVPRSIYAMASDGLLFECLSIVNRITSVPVYATLFAMFMVMVATTFVPLPELVEFTSIGVLLGYAFVAGAIILLRYGPDIQRNSISETNGELNMKAIDHFAEAQNEDPIHDDDLKLLDTTSAVVPGSLKHRFHATPVLRELGRFQPGSVVKVSLCCSVFFLVCTLALVEHAGMTIAGGEWWAILLLILFSFCSIGAFLVIPMHCQNDDTKEYFRVPLVPMFPWLSILCSVMLILKLRPITFLRYLIWLTIGLTIYTTYGYRHSKVGRILRRNATSEVRVINGNTSGENGATYGTTN